VENLSSSLTPTLIQTAYVILPAYNEAEALSALVPTIARTLQGFKKPVRILVVNDGSSDGTIDLISSLAKTHPVQELRHTVNRGYGAALATGLRWVAQNAHSADAAVTLDADNTQDPGYIPSLLTMIELGYDVVTASYTMEGGQATGIPALRRVMSGVINTLFRLICRYPGIETYTNGFRGYRAAAIQRVSQIYGEALIEEAGFPGGTEFFLKVLGAGGKAAQVPFKLHYERRGKGSKIRLVATIQRYLKLLSNAQRYAHA